MHLPVLPVRDGAGGAGHRAHQGPSSRHGVVHLSDPLLISTFSSSCSPLLFRWGFYCAMVMWSFLFFPLLFSPKIIYSCFLVNWLYIFSAGFFDIWRFPPFLVRLILGIFSWCGEISVRSSFGPHQFFVMGSSKDGIKTGKGLDDGDHYIVGYVCL